MESAITHSAFRDGFIIWAFRYNGASSDQKKARACRGVVVFEDEVSFGLRKTAHIYGAIAVDDARFTYPFAPVFNGHTFHVFLKLLVRRYRGRKVFVILDNGPCHWLDEAGRAWLRENGHRIESHRLPVFARANPIEGVWETTRRRTTHDRFYATVVERDAALIATFKHFQRRPDLIAGQIARVQ